MTGKKVLIAVIAADGGALLNVREALRFDSFALHTLPLREGSAGSVSARTFPDFPRTCYSKLASAASCVDAQESHTLQTS